MTRWYFVLIAVLGIAIAQQAGASNTAPKSILKSTKSQPQAIQEFDPQSLDAQNLEHYLGAWQERSNSAKTDSGKRRAEGFVTDMKRAIDKCSTPQKKKATDDQFNRTKTANAEAEDCDAILKSAYAAIQAYNNIIPDEGNAPAQAKTSPRVKKTVRINTAINTTRAIPKEGKGKPTPPIQGRDTTEEKSDTAAAR